MERAENVGCDIVLINISGGGGGGEEELRKKLLCNQTFTLFSECKLLPCNKCQRGA